MKHLMGLRTFIGCLVAIVALVVGLWLLKEDQRGGAYFAFGGSIVAALGVLGTKSTLTAAANGEGLTKAMKNIAGPSKPGDSTP
jgi:preprotein translocase subunit SecG